MTNISEFSLTKLVNGIKNKDFTSEEVTKSFINNSKKSYKLGRMLNDYKSASETDMDTLRQDKVSITPLTLDLTNTFFWKLSLAYLLSGNL